MCEPWYQTEGPDANYVRQEIHKKIKSLKEEGKTYKYEKEKEKMIEKILYKHVPDSRNDFGSYRGYYTFVHGHLYNTIIKELRVEYAYFIINKHFRPHVVHKLYRPGGRLYEKTRKTTLVGKN